MNMMKVLLSAALLASITSAANVGPNWDNSFKPPFSDFVDKKRVIESWETFGDASIKENFVRLTPDRQSKVGYMVNKKPLESPNFSALMRFRISGKGKKLFGDGIAIWVTKDASFPTGNIFGRAPTFEGFAIVLDTFRNTEAGHVHKDISLLIGDGMTPVDLDSERPGCDSLFRYDEGTDEFSPTTSESALKFHLKGSTVSVYVRRRPEEEFHECFSHNLAESRRLPQDWKSGLTFAISATTGALADNHDILELTSSLPRVFEEWLSSEEEEKETPIVDIDVSKPKELQPRALAQQINILSEHVKDIEKQLYDLTHNVEHKDEEHGSEIQEMLRKMRKNEEKLEERIKELELAAGNIASSAIEGSVAQVERKVKSDIGTRISKLESSFGKQMSAAQSASAGWKWPLIGMVICFILFAWYTNRSVTKLKNADKLF